MRMKEVVHCETQEQWDEVNNKLPDNNKIISEWSDYGDQSCRDINFASYTGLNYYQKEGYKIYSFEEWKEKFDNKEFIIPEYWMLQINPQNIEAITKWRIGVFGAYGDVSNKNYIYSNGSSRKPIDGEVYTQISTYEFINHVVKNSVNKFVNKEFLPLMKLLKTLDIN